MERQKTPFVRLLTAVAIFTGQFTNPIPPTKEEIATRLNKVDCSFGEPKDLIAVFGAGSWENEYGETLPTSEQYARLQAAALAYTQGMADNIILLDGSDNSAFETSIKFLQDQVKELSDGKMNLSRNNVFSTTGDINTATNAQSLKRFVDKSGLTKVLAITDNSHAVRAEMLACNWGVNSKMITVESMGITTYTDYSWYVFFKENAEIHLLSVDPLGKIPTAAKSLTEPASQP